MNPFITLTRIKEAGDVDININHIVCFQQKTYRDSPRKYTYIVLSVSGSTREVEETPETIREMIKLATFSIPFTGIKGA